MISEIFTRQEIHAAARMIDNASSVAILTHISPDGDALGSSLAMQRYLKILGKAPVAVIVPNTFPQFLSWLPAAQDILVYEQNADECGVILREADLIICLDFNSSKRIGKVGPLLDASESKKLVIDHHIDPDIAADLVMSYPSATSTCELVFRFICQSGNFDFIDQPTAVCIYTGMMTDTGNFSYNSNHPELYNIVAQLVTLGVDKDDIYNRVFNTYSAERLRLTGYCLYHKMRLFKHNKRNSLALIALSSQELLRFNFHSGDAEGLVNLPLQIGDVYLSVMMREDTDKIKISFRSQGDHPVNEFAAKYFGGGGHKNAAGGEFYGSLDDAVRLLEQHVNELYEQKQPAI